MIQMSPPLGAMLVAVAAATRLASGEIAGFV
jgi:hypothetical protein